MELYKAEILRLKAYIEDKWDIEISDDNLREAVRLENGILYDFDVTKVMFASGNVDERERMKALDCALPGNVYPTAGLDLRDKTVGIIGHMNGPRGLRDIARAVYVLERDPRPGDYPDAACDWLLPRCDVVLITGSSLINKTLPHLLELCENAVTILTGPSVPMCPALLDFGIDRLAGFVVTEREAMTTQVKYSVHGSPYGCGQSFLLMK